MRLLLLTQYYPPETGAAPLRAYHFATKLAKRGHEVTVVTGMPNHPSGVKATEYRRRVGARERQDGVRIVRCYLYASPNKTFAKRMANQISFMVSAFFGGCSAGRCDAILVSSPPLFLGATAWLLGLVKGVPYVLDLRDFWPHAAVELGQLRSRRAISLAKRLERFLYRRAGKLIAVTPGMERLMLENGVPRYRIALITNGADTELFRPPDDGAGAAGAVADTAPIRASVGAALTGERAGDGGRTVLYSGTHGLVHGMEVILDAADLLRREPGVMFRLVGDGVVKPRLVSEAERRGLTNVEFLPSRQPADLADLMRGADVCLATTREGDFSAGTIPVKLFDYMASGKPIVASLDGDARDVIESAGCGIVTPPGDAPALADAVRKLLGDRALSASMGARGREFVCREYSRQTLAQRLEELLEDVVASEGRMCGSRLRFRRYLGVKYTIDVIGALLLLIIGSPVFAIMAAAIKLDSPGKPIFTQRRIGVHSEEFTIYKFRTMSVGTPDLAADLMSPVKTGYVTRLGRFLRRTSADELPNCWNVLKGDMSMVGPRPALYNQSELIDMRRQVRVDLVRPGLTGWAQINGRDEVELEEKVRLDHFYVQNCSLLMDLAILLRTFLVLRKTGGE